MPTNQTSTNREVYATHDMHESRRNIDKIDTQITNLFVQRMAECANIAKLKSQNNLPILDEKREQEKMQQVTSLVPQNLKNYTVLLYEKIFELSRNYQEQNIETNR